MQKNSSQTAGVFNFALITAGACAELSQAWPAMFLDLLVRPVNRRLVVALTDNQRVGTVGKTLQVDGVATGGVEAGLLHHACAQRVIDIYLHEAGVPGRELEHRTVHACLNVLYHVVHRLDVRIHFVAVDVVCVFNDVHQVVLITDAECHFFGEFLIIWAKAVQDSLSYLMISMVLKQLT